MKLVVGLGNPGKQYENTRHNVGFIVLDYLAQYYDFKFEVKKKYQIGTASINGEKVLFVKPQTFMNLSGEAVIEVMNFYKLNVEDIIVVFDDLDMEFGKLRVKQDSSSGGHNGIKNIINHLHTQNFMRIKVGINNSYKKDVKSFVLSNFSKDEAKQLNDLNSVICNGILAFIDNQPVNYIQGELNK